jgi:hypothetical protein
MERNKLNVVTWKRGNVEISHKAPSEEGLCLENYIYVQKNLQECEEFCIFAVAKENS